MPLLRKMLIVLLPAGLFFLFSGCQSNTLFTGLVNVRGAWAKGDAAKFVVEVPDTVTVYNFFVDVRHTVKYRYSNLYLFMQTRFPDSTYTRDTLELVLATPEGKWLGKGWGKVKEDHVLVRKGFRFPEKGKYEFFIWQGMRTDTLKAVRSVGIDIEKAD